LYDIGCSCAVANMTLSLLDVANCAVEQVGGEL
jgi:hypothetical protein